SEQRNDAGPSSPDHGNSPRVHIRAASQIRTDLEGVRDAHSEEWPPQEKTRVGKVRVHPVARMEINDAALRNIFRGHRLAKTPNVRHGDDFPLSSQRFDEFRAVPLTLAVPQEDDARKAPRSVLGDHDTRRHDDAGFRLDQYLVNREIAVGRFPDLARTALRRARGK